jgi:UDP-N-acetylglucosamine/UDP-N-acetylgalactosamine diphosphorylase
MLAVPDALRRQLREYGQDHVLAWWDALDDAGRRGLLEQVEALDLPQLRDLYARRDNAFPLPASDRIAPVPVIRPGPGDGAARARGEESLRRGEVAVLLVAGGQGSRLGFDHPKGQFPVGPVSGKTLFQIHAEKVLALQRRYGRPVPFLIMTSDATHAETVAFFAEHSHFDLSADDVRFFQQGTMPALDLATGRLLMEERGRLFTGPNGHGGTLTALASSGLLGMLRDRGFRQVFYFQVDNPLVKVADPTFLGHHLTADAEVSCKIVPKIGPTDKLGNLVLVDGRLTMIEYSDLPKHLAEQTDADGNLRIWAGSPAIHYFSVEFLERMTAGPSQMPFHVARKKVPYLDAGGTLVKPDRENALKFELFIFDVLPRADRWTVVETSRAEEFAPLKNATGADSPEAVKQALTELAADWLRRASVAVPTGVPLEVNPLLALDADELADRVDRNLRITGPLYLTPGSE